MGSDAHQQALPTVEYMLIRRPASGKRNANTCTKAYKMSWQETKCHVREETCCKVTHLAPTQLECGKKRWCGSLCSLCGACTVSHSKSVQVCETEIMLW